MGYRIGGGEDWAIGDAWSVVEALRAIAVALETRPDEAALVERVAERVFVRFMEAAGDQPAQPQPERIKGEFTAPVGDGSGGPWAVRLPNGVEFLGWFDPSGPGGMLPEAMTGPGGVEIRLAVVDG